MLRVDHHVRIRLGALASGWPALNAATKDALELGLRCTLSSCFIH
eukprot:COSAG06_NODE_27725_length_587_cov_1.739754_2_plen_44_part_01